VNERRGWEVVLMLIGASTVMVLALQFLDAIGTGWRIVAAVTGLAAYMVWDRERA